ncbi:hypothetical protein RRG08_064345 [Elysia crispata]|uniref:Uncharacterized protein n=1 Tax=Elysia crispata TaxID=231223 RepID=A0AAE1DIY5_9GAST|nr:hypothetical protein RRG08_064345 [Elysia crispata]
MRQPVVHRPSIRPRQASPTARVHSRWWRRSAAKDPVLATPEIFQGFTTAAAEDVTSGLDAVVDGTAAALGVVVWQTCSVLKWSSYLPAGGV